MMRQNPDSRRFERIASAIAAAIAVAAAFNAIDALPVGVFYDDALYAILGKSLATGHGYRYLNIPGSPNATHYPPGYPLLLAALWRITPTFPENAALFKGVNALFVGAIAWFACRFARDRLDTGPWLSAFIALAGTAAIPLLVLSSAVMSETLFLALLLPWLIVAERSVRDGDERRTMLLAGTAALLFYVRAHAIVLLPALAIALALAGPPRRRSAAVSLGVGVAMLLPWFLWVAVNDAAIPEPLRGSYGSYGAWLASGVRASGAGVLLSALRDNCLTTAAIITRSFALSQARPMAILALIAVLVLFGAGCARLYQRARVTVLFIALYLAVVLVWPFSPLRFIWGIWPLIVVLLAAGALALVEPRTGTRGRVLRGVGIGATAIAMAGMLWFNVRGYANGWWTTVSRSITPRIQPQLEWASRRVARGTVVAADDEGALYLYTGARAVPANVFTADQYVRPRSPNENAVNLARIVDTFRPRYVIAWAYPTIAAAESLSARAGDARLVRIDTLGAGGRVYERAGVAAADLIEERKP